MTNIANLTRRYQFSRVLALTAIVASSFFINACSKGGGSNKLGSTRTCNKENESSVTSTVPGKGVVTRTLSGIVTVAGIRPIEGSSTIEVFFNENTEFFNVSDVAAIATIKDAFSANKPIRITFDPWQGVVLKAAYPSLQDAATVSSRKTISSPGTAQNIDLSRISDEVLNNPSEMGVLNSTDPGLNNLIPDFATAQLMFDYICNQCCYLPGPYAIDYCIPFQYCIDGCYARAHKMCWIINNRYRYGTKKIFSFANSGSDKLCVQGQKWGGCCIRWWYHVAPLVTIKTPTGPKAYVFDPAMFNQPVLLSTWLHAQENPACAASFNPHVTMINVQPNSSYWPSGSSGMVFGTDPTYSLTNAKLDEYRYYTTCP